MTEATIPDETMEAILAMKAWDEIILTAWLAVEPDFSKMETVDPKEYTIPKDQWDAICTKLISLSKSSISNVNHGLDWMNIGPGAR